MCHRKARSAINAFSAAPWPSISAGDQRDALWADVEALAVGLRIDADLTMPSGMRHCFVDDAALEHGVAANVGAGQDDRIFLDRAQLWT